jgi:hypothetical protein
MTLTLTRSSDRKTAAAATPNGKGVKVNNAFGLPAGKAFSCPGATPICERVCYAGRIEKQYKAFLAVVMSNFDILRSQDEAGMTTLLTNMISEFVAECERKSVPAFFRIHHDGDFFSLDYANAWANVCRAFPNVTFWVYTRSFTSDLNVVPFIAGIDNLNVLLSVDAYNKEAAKAIIAEFPDVAIASLADTFAEAADVSRDIRENAKPGGACPELTKAIPLISDKGGACFACGLCTVKRTTGPIDIRFAVKKR